jgi:hypothetical protein
VSRRPTAEQIPLLQTHYDTCRALLASGHFSQNAIIKLFEALPYSVLGAHSWRPTHITLAAREAILTDWARRFQSVQRAHGVLPGRVDRHVRTLQILQGPATDWETWWESFVSNDATVLCTRTEHSRGDRWTETELIPLPPPETGLFMTRGFTVRLSARGEGAWLRQLSSVGAVGLSRDDGAAGVRGL